MRKVVIGGEEDVTGVDDSVKGSVIGHVFKMEEDVWGGGEAAEDLPVLERENALHQLADKGEDNIIIGGIERDARKSRNALGGM